MGTLVEKRMNRQLTNELEVIGQFTFGSSYVAGGESCDPGLTELRHVQVHGSPGGMVFNYDLSTRKLKAYRVQAPDFCYSKAGLAIGATTPKKGVTFANTINYTNDGVWQTAKTTAEYAFTATTHDIPPNASAVQEACYLYTIDAGTVTVTMGEIASGAGNAVWPAGPAGGAVVGGLRLAVAAGATLFNATTDDLDAAHLTDTYYDFAYGPNQLPYALTEVAAGMDIGTIAGAIEVIFKGKN